VPPSVRHEWSDAVITRRLGVVGTSTAEDLVYDDPSLSFPTVLGAGWRRVRARPRSVDLERMSAEHVGAMVRVRRARVAR
jgi:hypothetical protein